MSGTRRVRTWVGKAALFASATLAAPASAQVAPIAPAVSSVLRPVPGPVVPPPWYRAAVADGTRRADGRPGPRYWTNFSTYDIRAELDPASARIIGSETIVYQNNSPDTLTQLVLDLYLNIHQAGGVRSAPEEVTGGVGISRVTVDGAPAVEGALFQPSRWTTSGTVMRISPPRPVLPGGTTTLTIEWSEVYPQTQSGRAGWSDHEVYFVGYWFPRMAVYDDLRGWDAEPYLGNAEFYDGFGDYRVSLTGPAGWSVIGTGALQNPADVWSAETRRRLAAAATADSVVHVATRADRSSNRVTLAGTAGKLVYQFDADTVRDFTWTASNTQLWDATSARVPGRDRALIHSFWREQRAPLWVDMAKYGKDGVERNSRITGFAYPWPHMTLVEGADIIGGGMEFPMLTLIGTYQGSPPKSLYSTGVHEIAHMWFPMIVGVNETRWAWIDEGNASFLEDQARPGYWPGDGGEAADRADYLATARAEQEQPLMTHGDYYEPGPGYVVASYYKPATLLATLRGLIGKDAFTKAYQAFVSEWAYKHPTPWDFFATFERFAGQDLDWFWQAFYYETWVLDQAVGGVTTRNAAAVVAIEDYGFAPMPARVRITTSQGGTLDREVPVSTWLSGATRAEIVLPASVGIVTRVEIDPERLFPDLNPGDDVWVSGAPN